jgi:drug/metabolite transporter (DMT)-like permease
LETQPVDPQSLEAPPSKNQSISTQSLPYILLVGLVYGTTLVASRFSVGQFDPVIYIGLRLLLVTLALATIYIFRIGRRKWPKGRQLWQHGVILGIFGTAIPMTGIVVALQYLSSGLAAVLITINPAITVVLAHFFLADEPLTRRKVFGVIIALGGAIFLAALGETGLAGSEGSLLGYFLIFLGMLSGSAMTIYTRKYMQACDPIDVTSIRMLIATLVVLPVAAIFIGFDFSQTNSQGWLALIYAAVFGTFLGMLLSFYNVQRFGATAAVMAAYVIPVIASLTGVLLLDEIITPGMLAGMGMIIIGVWLINRG